VSHHLRAAGWLGLGCFLFYTLLGHGHFKGSDEIAVYEGTRALWEQGDLVVGKGPHVFGGRDGRLYSHFAVGQSVLALPFYGLGKLLERALPEAWTRTLAGPRRPPRGRAGGRIEIWSVLLLPPLLSSLLVVVFYLFQRRLGASAPAALAAAGLLGTTTYVVTHSAYFLRHTTEALTLLAALYGFHCYRHTGRLGVLALASSAASLTLLVRVPAAVAAPALAGYLGWALWERASAGDGRERIVRAVAVGALPLAVALAVHVGMNQLKWATWFASPMLGQVVYFDTPIQVGLRGLLLSPGSSIFVYSPLLLLCPWLLVRFARTHPAECATLGVIVASFLLVCATFWSWSGLWAAPGPRYLFVATPLLLLPLGPWLDSAFRRRARVALAAVAVLAVVGLGVQLAVTLSSWNTVVDVEGWRSFEPGMEFLFVPAESPVLAGVRALGAGYVDSWIWWIGSGWRGHPPQPGLAVLLAAGGLLGVAFCLARSVHAARALGGVEGAGGAEAERLLG